MSEYNIKKDQFKSGPFSESQVNQLLDTWSDQIRDALIEARNMYGDAISINEWEYGLYKLKNQLDFARNN
ncbi:MAG: hypothetical protein IMY71_03005 [Bacteroidetes bacterium]|nr:hypothetical protein [Bacteroidota bacterium]